MQIYGVKILDIENEELEYLISTISWEKREKIKKFWNKKDKIRSLIGEVLVRTKLSKIYAIENKKIIFEKNNFGKLYIKGKSNCNFNISHSGEWIICAIDSKPIGIDVEKIKCIEYEEIVKNFFSSNEIDYIMNRDKNLRLERFYEIWTLKESYIKCCGKGLSIPLKSFSINIGIYNIKVIKENQYLKYKLEILDIDQYYKVAVCSLNKRIPPHITKINQRSLLNEYYKIIF